MRRPALLCWLLMAVVIASTCGTCIFAVFNSNSLSTVNVFAKTGDLYHLSMPYSGPPLEIPFQCVVHIDFRRVWCGMRGGRLHSGTLGRRGKRSDFHNGGAYDVAMFLWTQMVISGKCPHPGPEGSARAEQGNNNAVVPLRVTSSAGGTSSSRGVHLYDVYTKIIPIHNISYKEAKKHLLRLNTSEWLARWLERRCHFLAVGSNVCNINGKNASPALYNISEIHQFFTYVHDSVKGQSKQLQVKTNVRRFFTEYGDQLRDIWPSEDTQAFQPTFVQPPCDDISNPQNNQQQSWNTNSHPTSFAAIRNVSVAMGVQFQACGEFGVYSTQIELHRISELVELLGIYSCTKYVHNSFTKRASPYRFVRYQCFRGPIRKSKAGLKPGIKTRDKRIGKCACPAVITGSYTISTAIETTLVELTLDLRHVGHEPGTVVDARLLPLLPDVKARLDNITCLFRNLNLVREYLDAWVRNEYLPNKHPCYTQALHMLDHRFNPTDRDIMNSCATAGRNLQFSAIDQESTFILLASQHSMNWVIRPAQGDTTAYSHSSASQHVSAIRILRKKAHDTCHVTTKQLSLNNVSAASDTYFQDVVRLCYHVHVPAKTKSGAAGWLLAPSTYTPTWC